MSYPETFEGFQVESHSNWSDFKRLPIKPKKFEDRDVDVQIDACGVCGSDVHTITGGWGDVSDMLPLTVGHEVIGRVVKTGPGVKTLKVGDRVGVGAQIGACLECKNCKSDNENYCPKQIDTYGAPSTDGTITQGGYSSHIRAHEYFTFKIPDAIPTHEAAPMLCAGITVYSPLVRAKTGPGKTVAIVGIGGLGHFALIFAKALGATVYALSHSPSKKDDALKLGADHFVSTGEKDWHKPLAFTFDFILNTADMTNEFNLHDYMSTLAVNGAFHNVGLPDKPLPTMMAQDFMGSGGSIGASHIGSRPEMESMLKLVADKDLHPFIETIDISEAGCKEAVERVKKNDVRYRFTLVGFEKAFSDVRIQV